MRTIFIADAHLNAPSDANYLLLLRFLKELEGTVGTILVLGDLFDFWVGLPGMPLPDQRPAIEALERLVDTGTRLIYFEGNHDFQLGPVFRRRLRAKVHEGPAELELQGKRLHICHGDQINPGDHGYRFLRRLLRSLPVRLAINVCPAPLAMAAKERLQRHSRGTYEKKGDRWDYRSIISGYAQSRRESGLDGLVCGHFHLPFIERLDNPSFTTLSLGDWISQSSYGEMIDGELHLKQYLPAAG